VTVVQLLQVLSVLEPLVEDVAQALESDQKELPVSLQDLPAELKSEIELRYLKARVGVTP
jgi:hypothetical protein